ncbi:MAG: class I SAM-dependent methyltransferase [Actinomycetota bacterium]|nr:class I SAM-dependent methyltransferase [Actinomycetota bacterium]
MDTSDPSGADWEPLDAAYRRLLARPGPPPGGVLLAQTVGTAAARRAVLATVPLQRGVRHLDLGTGFGVMPLELAHLAPIDALGIDTDPDVLRDAATVRDELSAWLSPGAVVDFAAGDAAALDLGANSVDLVTARLLFQHLPDPAVVAQEISRVLRPGGAVHIFDVDDGLGLTWPPLGEAQQALEAAYAATQRGRGGDRTIGRKLPSLLAEAGLEIESTIAVPNARFALSEPRDLGRMSVAGRVAAAADAIVACGALRDGEIDELLQRFLDAPSFHQLQVETQLVIIARRR